MPEPIRVAFATVGTADVERAFDTIAKRANDLMRLQVSTAQRAARVSSKAADDEVKNAQKKMRAVDAWVAREEKAEQRRKQNYEKTLQKLEQERAKADSKAVAAADKRAQAEVRAQQKAYDQKLRAAERAEQAMVRLGERERTRRERMLAQQIARENKLVANNNTAFGRGVSNAFGRAGRTVLGSASGIIGGVAASGGTYAIGSALVDAMDLQRQSALLANSVTPPGMTSPIQPEALIRMAQNVAGGTGFKSTDVIGAMSNVAAKAGGLKGLSAFMGDIEDLSKTAISAGVSIEDMGGVFSAAFNAGIKPGEEMRQLMLDLVAVGKEGSVEFKDLAAELPRLAGAGLAFGTGGQMIRRAVGMAQIAVKQRVSPEEARTSVIDVFRDVDTKARYLKDSGITPYTKEGKQRDPAEVMADIVAASFGGKGINAGGRRGMIKGREALSFIFTGTSLAVASAAAEEYTTKGKSRNAIIDMFNDAGGVGKPAMTSASRDAEYNRVMGTSAQQLAVNLEQFKSRIAELLPEVNRLIPKVVDVTKGIADLANYLSQNPLAGIGTLFAGFLSVELAKAGIGAIFDKAMTSAMALRGNGIGGGLGTTGNLLAAASIAITATTVTIAAMKWIDSSSEEGESAGRAARESEIKMGNVSRALAAAQTPEEKQKLLAEAASLQAGYGKVEKNYREAKESWNPVTRSGADKDDADTTLQTLRDQKKAFDEVVLAAKKAAGALNNVSSVDPSRVVPVSGAPNAGSGRGK